MSRYFLYFEIVNTSQTATQPQNPTWQLFFNSNLKENESIKLYPEQSKFWQNKLVHLNLGKDKAEPTKILHLYILLFPPKVVEG